MQAYEFQTTRTEDVIKIPKKFTKKLAKNIRVIILSDEPIPDSIVERKRTPQERREAWERIKELCKNVDPNIDEKKELAEYREEKYGRID